MVCMYRNGIAKWGLVGGDLGTNHPIAIHADYPFLAAAKDDLHIAMA